MRRLERALLRHLDVLGLLLRERGQLGAELVEMEGSDLLVELLCSAQGTTKNMERQLRMKLSLSHGREKAEGGKSRERVR